MGMILESTPEMGEYGVEVRRESFYLRAEPGEDGRHEIIVYPNSPDPVPTGTAEILLEDIPKIRACLDEIEAYLSRRSG
jgi:hypothetical protein